MKKAAKTDWKFGLFPLLACVVLALLGLAYYTGSFKIPTVICAVVLIFILATHDLSNLRHPAALLLLGYVTVAGLSWFWAISGKFFIKEYSKIFVAACLFVGVLVWRKFDRGTVRTLFSGMTGMAAVYAFLSVEYVTTGISKLLVELLVPGMMKINVTVNPGVRLNGIFDATNAQATLMAMTVLLGIYLLTTEENPKKRVCHSAVLAMNAFVLLSLFSMASLGFFALSIVVYLLAAGKSHAKSFVHMLIGAIPTLVFVFGSFSFFGAESALKMIPLVALLADAVVVAVLEQKLAPKLIPVLEQHEKLALGSIVGVILLAVVYVVAGMNISAPHTFGQDFLTRSFYPDAGTHTMSIQADGDVQVIIDSQTRAQAIMTTMDRRYNGTETEITFEIPEDTVVAYAYFSAQPGVTIERAVLDGSKEIALKYPLLPDFVTTRMQGLFAKDSALQRTALFNDGLELFAMKPLTGHGVGSFETAITYVQDFHFETKYIHNHYIQILEECGILGIVPFVGSLFCMIWLLLKKRKDGEWEYRDLYAPLLAVLTMVLTHSAFEFSLSNDVVLWFTYVIFAILIRSCIQTSQEEQQAEKKKGELAFMLVCVALCGAFALSICCNMIGGYLLNSPVRSEEEFMQNLSTAALIDPYEYNDAKLSYVMLSIQSQNGDLYREKANEYAAVLRKAHSNTIPKMLVEYYLATGQYYEAVDAALAGASYSASDAETWNDTAQLFRAGMFDPMGSPLYMDAQGLGDKLMSYYDALRQYNASNMKDVDISLATKDLFGKLLAVCSGDGSMDHISTVLAMELFDSATACDANADGIPDQIRELTGAAVEEDGSIAAQNGAYVWLDLYTEYTDATVQVTISCDDPEAVALSYWDTELTPLVENGQAVFFIPVVETIDNTTRLGILSKQDQTISAIRLERIPSGT